MSSHTITPRKRKYNYDLYDQKRLILLSQSDGQSQARVCKEYDIPKGTFSGWKAKIDLSIEYQKGQYTLHSGKKSLGDHLEQLLVQFIDSTEVKQSECTVDSIALKVIQFDKDFLDGDYSRVKKWVYRFLDRNQYSIRMKTHVAQNSCDLDLCLDVVMHCNELISLQCITLL